MSALVDGLQGVGDILTLGEVSPDGLRIIVGIDFGTAYSGIAFALRADPGSVFFGAPTATDISQVKVPTSLLLLENKTWEFGHNAERIYSEMLMSHTHGEPIRMHLFRQYKMVLSGADNGFATLNGISIDGYEHNLLAIITATLKILKDYALEKIAIGCGGKVQPQKEIQWVLTVPAIWNDFGKAFMRKAAYGAGMTESEQSDHVMMVLEPEGASLSVHVGAAKHNLLGETSRFLVLDCGGGTVDISTLEVTGVRPLVMKAIAAPTGGKWGGTYVNSEFKKFLQELLGPELSDESASPMEFYGIYNDFERLKLSFDGKEDPAPKPILGTSEVVQPVLLHKEKHHMIRLVDVLDKKSDLIQLAAAYNLNHPDTPIVTTNLLRNGLLTMSVRLMLSFFEPFLQPIVDETRRVMAQVPYIRHIMLVGGFGSSPVLVNRIRAEFEKLGVRVILPERPKPQGAIVHGAVYYGLYKHIIHSRVSKYTYGIAMHNHAHEIYFKVLVTEGQELPLNHEANVIGCPMFPDHTIIAYRVYRSSLRNPTSVTGEHRLGVVNADCPLDPDQSKRRQTGMFKFGGAEISVRIVNAVGSEFLGVVTMV